MQGYFNKYAAKGNEFMRALASEPGMSNDQGKAGRVLRCVLHSIRNHISIEESLQLVAQLPMAVKSIYVEGWKPVRKIPRIRNIREMAEEVISMQARAPQNADLANLPEAINAIRVVVRTMNKFVSDGELEDVAEELPRQLNSFMRSIIQEKQEIL